MNDQTGKNSFPNDEYQINLIKRGYVGQLTKTTMQKGEFPPPMKFLFHTLLTCVSNKTTAFNEIPLKFNTWGMLLWLKLISITPKKFSMI
ncbi:hypothetical protein Hanom_Chr06g00532611 [Helianthus anomalus]